MQPWLISSTVRGAMDAKIKTPTIPFSAPKRISGSAELPSSLPSPPSSPSPPAEFHCAVRQAPTSTFRPPRHPPAHPGVLSNPESEPSRQVLSDQHDHRVTPDGALLADAVHLLVRLGLQQEGAQEWGPRPGQDPGSESASAPRRARSPSQGATVSHPRARSARSPVATRTQRQPLGTQRRMTGSPGRERQRLRAGHKPARRESCQRPRPSSPLLPCPATLRCLAYPALAGAFRSTCPHHPPPPPPPPSLFPCGLSTPPPTTPTTTAPPSRSSP